MLQGAISVQIDQTGHQRGPARQVLSAAIRIYSWEYNDRFILKEVTRQSESQDTVCSYGRVASQNQRPHQVENKALAVQSRNKENTEGCVSAARTLGVDIYGTCGKKCSQHRLNGLGGSMLWPWSEVVSVSEVVRKEIRSRLTIEDGSAWWN